MIFEYEKPLITYMREYSGGLMSFVIENTKLPVKNIKEYGNFTKTALVGIETWSPYMFVLTFDNTEKDNILKLVSEYSSSIDTITKFDSMMYIPYYEKKIYNSNTMISGVGTDDNGNCNITLIPKFTTFEY